MKVFIAGINGFVGRHLTRELTGQGYEVQGMDLAAGPGVTAVDILDASAVADAVGRCAPDYVINLAAQASVGLSWANPQLTFDINVKGALNLMDAVRALGRPARMLIIGSSDQYGIIRPEDCPVGEEFPMDPRSPYAISKHAQELMVRAYIKAHGMDIIMTRSFNHIGPGQRKGFVVADFASRIAAIEKGDAPVLTVGNLEARRDFTDVRDVVRAYRLLCEKGRTGEIYNVGSGRVYRIRELLDMLIGASDAGIEVRIDPDKMRPSDLPVIQCDNAKIRAHTGWEPLYAMEKTLADTLDDWRNQ